jgi:hypothetical protein
MVSATIPEIQTGIPVIRDFHNVPRTQVVTTQIDEKRVIGKGLAKQTLRFDYQTEDLKFFLGEDGFNQFISQLEKQNPDKAISQTDYDVAFLKYLTISSNNQLEKGLGSLKDIANKVMSQVPSLLIYSAGQEVQDLFEHQPRLTQKAIEYLVLDDERSGLASQFKDFNKSTNYNITSDAKRELFYELAMRVLRAKVIKAWTNPKVESQDQLYQARSEALKQIQLIEKGKETSMLTSRSNKALTLAQLLAVSAIVLAGLNGILGKQVTDLNQVVGDKQLELEQRRGLSILQGDTIPTSTQEQALKALTPTEQQFFRDLSNELIKQAKLRFPNETKREFSFLLGKLEQDKIKMILKNEGRIHFTIPIRTFQELYNKSTVISTETSPIERLILELPKYLN